MRTVCATTFGLLALAACFSVPMPRAHAQDIEPRAYSNAPIGVNFLIGGYAYSRGGLPFDPSLPIKDARLQTSNAVLAYARSLDWWGKSAKFDVIVPYTWLSGSADYAGQRLERIVNGAADPAFRLSVNFYGAPALALHDFIGYEQDLIIGASLRVSAPLGQYDHGRVVNIGANRWSFRPEVGISKASGQWTLELTGAAVLFTDNTDFYGGGMRSQKPIYAIQGHAIHSFRSGAWASFDATYFAGGRSTIDGVLGDDLQQNWRLGATLAVPVDVRHSIKFYASDGVSARTGNNFGLFGIAWQYRWGGGL